MFAFSDKEIWMAAVSFDRVFGVHQHTMRVRNDRAEILAGNLANADTPAFKARDIDFNQALIQANSQLKAEDHKNPQMAKTAAGHMDISDLEALRDPELLLKYRQPFQPDTGNGNTVEVNTERMNYLSNTIEYQATMQFLNNRIRKMRSSFSGQ